VIAFSYSGDPATSIRDEVRFLVQDTDETCPLLTDAECDYIIDKWMTLYDSALYCAAVAAGTIARKWAKVVNISAGGTSASVGDLQTRYVAMADQLMKDYRAEGDVGGLVNLENILAGTEFDPTIEPLQFSMALMDNPQAGSQNYGGRTGAYADELRGF
jgi:hypothetical protein